MSGPYNTRADADARHVYEAHRRENQRGTTSRFNAGLLLAALAGADVEVGACRPGANATTPRSWSLSARSPANRAQNHEGPCYGAQAACPKAAATCHNAK
jgi:hypothetical protein